MTTASKQAKAAGLKSLSQASEISTLSHSELITMHKSKPKLFRVVILGCVQTLDQEQPIGSHWYCSHCDQRVPEVHVTFNERHTYCGNGVKWLDKPIEGE